MECFLKHRALRNKAVNNHRVSQYGGTPLSVLQLSQGNKMDVLESERKETLLKLEELSKVKSRLDDEAKEYSTLCAQLKEKLVTGEEALAEEMKQLRKLETEVMTKGRANSNFFNQMQEQAQAEVDPELASLKEKVVSLEEERLRLVNVEVELWDEQSRLEGEFSQVMNSCTISNSGMESERGKLFQSQIKQIRGKMAEETMWRVTAGVDVDKHDTAFEAEHQVLDTEIAERCKEIKAIKTIVESDSTAKRLESNDMHQLLLFCGKYAGTEDAQ
jgi:hypothetical protein